MKVLVIYDSVFGNTEKIAQAVGHGFGSQAEVTVLQVGAVTPAHLRNINLLVVGSPTRAFRPTPAMKKWIATIPKQGLAGMKVAAFDTRISVDDVESVILPPMIHLFGYAAQPILDSLVKKGGERASDAEGFFVNGTEGPLKDGELDRATAWGQAMTMLEPV